MSPAIPEANWTPAEIAATFARMKRDEARRMNPLTAWFEDYPFVSNWTSFMREHCGRDGSPANLYERYKRNYLWFAVIRPRVLQRDWQNCWVCRGHATEVHHASYHPFVMVGLADEWLYSVCRRCHEFVHRGPSDRPGTSNHDLWRRLNLGRVHRQVKLRRQYGETLPTRKQVKAWHALGNAQAEYAQLIRGVDWAFNQMDSGAMTTKPLETALSSPAFLHLVELRLALEPHWIERFEWEIAKRSVRSDQLQRLLTEAKLRADDFVVQEEPKKVRKADATKERATREDTERRGCENPFALGQEHAALHWAAVETYNAKPPDRCPFARGTAEEAEYDRGWKDWMRANR